MLTREVEMFVATTDHRWETSFVKIPIDTPEEEIERVAIAQLQSECEDRDDIAMIAIYHISEIYS